MFAKIYRPAKTAMQSGTANTDAWVLEYVPAKSQAKDPLMGWTGAGSTLNQVRMRFDSEAAAIAYAEKHDIPFQRAEPKARKHIIRPGGYGDNFSTQRRVPWSH